MADVYYLTENMLDDIKDIIPLTPTLYKRFFRVMRHRHGDMITLTDGKGQYLYGVLDEKAAAIKIMEIRKVPDDRIPLNVFLPLIKRERMKWVISKLGEIGVKSIIPVITERTTIRKWSDNNKKRCQALLGAALEVRSGAWITECQDIQSFDEIYKHVNCFLDIDGDSIRNYSYRGGTFSILIGPEGGLSESEKKKLLDVGAIPISLGKCTLRVETAAIVGTSIIAFWLGVLG